MKRAASARAAARCAIVAWIAAIVALPGCARSRPILDADLAALRPSGTAEAERDHVVVSAGVLARAEARTQLHLDAPARHVLPVTFRLQNGGEGPLRVEREDFLLRLNDRWQLTPVLPGRAAALLRDTTGSEQAAFAGWLLFGVFAAPSINAAEHREEETLEQNRRLVFDGVEVAAGDSVTGYLLFETPEDLDDLSSVELQLKPSWGATADGAPLSLRLVNPYVD